MTTDRSDLARRRIVFLFLLGLAITALFFWVIKGFLLALLMAAILAGLLQPVYTRLVKWVGGRKGLASGLTVVLSLFMVVLPLIWFMGMVVGEAIHISESAEDWLSANGDSLNSSIQETLEAHPTLQKLAPYQEKLITKATEMASKAGSWVAHGLAASVSGTGSFFLSLFVLLYALGFFLIGGQALLDGALRYTPLSDSDQSRLLGTFVSVTRATLKGKLIIGILQGGLAALSFWFAGIEGVLFWGTIMAVLSIIPAVGTALIWVPAVIYLALIGQTGAAIAVGLWCALVVGSIDNVLTPKLVGKDTQMPDLLVLLTTLGGLALFGVAGIVVGPIIGALFQAVWELLGKAIDESRGAAPRPAAGS